MNPDTITAPLWGGVLHIKSKLTCAPKNGDVGDCALLCSSPAEWRSGKARLPLLLRERLAELTPMIQTFNPRGEDLPSVPIVQIFGGLLLECLDAGGAIESTISGISDDVRRVFQEWRDAAIEFTDNPKTPNALIEYATGWIERDPKRKGFIWPRSVPIIDLIYGLVHFFPEFYDDPEGQVYLEVFTRQLTACEQVGKFDGRMAYDSADPGLHDASIKELMQNFLVPIASHAIKVNEDLMESFPRDRLNILSIHQSKGLEFPLTIVDVGSDFKDRRAPRFKRMPNKGGTPHLLEDLLRPYSPSLTGTLSRDQVDRAFDDLFRQYFVAFSRAQDVLILVGVDAADSDGRVENVATGWSRDQVKCWAGKNRPYLKI